MITPSWPFFSISTQTTLDLHTGTCRSMRPVLSEKTPPCTAECPAGQDVRGFIRLLAQGDPDGALSLILRDNPLPGVTGRVCHYPCMARCNRADMDGALTIRALERAAATYGRVELEVPPPGEKAVAVVGSGPAGLSCAFHLRKAGWAVTVFERDRSFGGLLRAAIPAYRLPREVLDADLARLHAMGIAFRGGEEVGKTVSLEELRDTFDAVFVALGAHSSQVLNVPGSERMKITGGLEFLKSVNGHGPMPSPGRVAVLGGGNTAVDVARTVKRLGGEPILCSPEAYGEMPALAEEVAFTEAEEVPILTEVIPTKFTAKFMHARVAGKPRRLEVDLVVAAIGEEVELGWLPPVLATNGLVAADAWGATPWKGVFAGGDCTGGERTVPHAIGAGQRVARGIDAYLRGSPPPAEESPGEVTRQEDVNHHYFELRPAAVVPEVPVEERISELSIEVVLGLARDVAEQEASRCLGCGTCIDCDSCLIFCPDLAVVRSDDGRGHRVLYEYCKGCGICVTECPSGVLELHWEGDEA